MEKMTFSKGLRDGLPIGLGYLSVSFAYGMMSVMAGLPLWLAVLTSLTNLTSAGQFAGTQLIMAGGAFTEIAITTMIINARYFLMSMSLSQKVARDMTIRERMAISFGVTDEIFGVASAQKAELTAAYMGGLIALPLVGWTLGTFLGGAATSLLPQSLSNALGIALYGMFIAIVTPVARKSRPVLITALLAILMSVLFRYLPFVSGLSVGWRIILITVAVSAFAAWKFPVEDEVQAGDNRSGEAVDKASDPLSGEAVDRAGGNGSGDDQEGGAR